ncbi:MAG: nucleoside triphosphate pyrophosphohydrolase [Chloroflexi bacterium]|nr:nucleoside triphosphate pyrophosphohydrolase [Chloroflexota bacterium]
MSDRAAVLVIVGLGPGSAEQLTPEARAWLTGPAPIIARTRRHPTLAGLPAAAAWETFDDLYDTAVNFEALYAAMLDRLRAALAAADGPVVYTVPGHPLFAEATVRAVLAAGLPARIVPGLSLLDAAAAALLRDPIAEGWHLLDALDLAHVLEAEPFGAGQLPLSPLRPALVCQVYNRRVASAVKLALARLLPDDHPVTLVQAAGVPGQERIITLPLFAIDRDERHTDHLTSLYVPAQPALAALRAPQALLHISARLRAPDGCPWDREQTHRSLLPHAIEEAYEVVEAIERDDPAALREELGDLLLQVVLHAQLAEEAGEFVFEDVVESIAAKLIRRHPHVFADVNVSGSADVLRNWDQIKAAERRTKGVAETAADSVFASIPRSLPALSRAQVTLRRALRLGVPPVTAVDAAAAVAAIINAEPPAMTDESRHDALGDVLLAVVRLAIALDIDAEEALRLATDAFRRQVEGDERRAHV